MPSSKLNLGCGYVYKKGWYNLDQYAVTRFYSDDTTILHWKAPDRIPFENSALEVIYCSHFLEHLYHEDCIEVLRECHRVLRKGGTLSVVLPDTGNMIKDYADGIDLVKKYGCQNQEILTNALPEPEMNIGDMPKEIKELRKKEARYDQVNSLMRFLEDITNVSVRNSMPEAGCISNIDIIAGMLVNSKHKQLYDIEKIKRQCEYVGFKVSKERSYNKEIDNENWKEKEIEISLFVDFEKTEKPFVDELIL